MIVGSGGERTPTSPGPSVDRAASPARKSLSGWRADGPPSRSGTPGTTDAVAPAYGVGPVSGRLPEPGRSGRAARVAAAAIGRLADAAGRERRSVDICRLRVPPPKGALAAKRGPAPPADAALAASSASAQATVASSRVGPSPSRRSDTGCATAHRIPASKQASTRAAVAAQCIARVTGVVGLITRLG